MKIKHRKYGIISSSFTVRLRLMMLVSVGLLMAGCGGGGSSGNFLSGSMPENTETPVIDQGELDGGEQEPTLNREDYVTYASFLFNSSIIVAPSYALSLLPFALFEGMDVPSSSETKVCDGGGESISRVYQSTPYNLSPSDEVRTTYNDCVEEALAPNVENFQNDSTAREDMFIGYTITRNGERKVSVLSNDGHVVLEIYTNITRVSTLGEGSTSIDHSTVMVTINEGGVTVESDRLQSGSSGYDDFYSSVHGGRMYWRYNKNGFSIETTTPFVFPEGSYNEVSPLQGRMEVSTPDGQLIVEIIPGNLDTVSVSYQGLIEVLPWIEFVNVGGLGLQVDIALDAESSE